MGILTVIEIFDKIVCTIALLFGIYIVPYSIYNLVSFVINKIGWFVSNPKDVKKYNGGYQPIGNMSSDDSIPPKGGSSVSKGE